MNKASPTMANSSRACAYKRRRPEKDSEWALVEHDRLTGLSCHPGTGAPEAVPLVEPPNALVVGVRPQLGPLETANPRLRKSGGDELTAYAPAPPLGATNTICTTATSVGRELAGVTKAMPTTSPAESATSKNAPVLRA